MNKDKGILLESGTGEVELMEFIVSDKHYVINVIKTKEILQVSNVTTLPNVNPAIAGMTLVRNNPITLLDLKYILDQEKRVTAEKCMTILCEFNKTMVAFMVDKIVGIHRIGWDKIMKPNAIIENSLVIGNIMMDNKILLLLDFEKIVMDLISSSYGVYDKRVKNITFNKTRSDVKLLLCDDSSVIRNMLKEVLIEAGYNNLTFFDDGQQTLDYLMNLKREKGENFLESVNTLITDIEMPQLDGHTLTRKIKEDPILNKLPIIIFSSLITADLHHKGESVGADAQMSKPDIDNLVDVIDKFTLRKQ